jgi:hypothetical protein
MANDTRREGAGSEESLAKEVVFAMLRALIGAHDNCLEEQLIECGGDLRTIGSLFTNVNGRVVKYDR